MEEEDESSSVLLLRCLDPTWLLKTKMSTISAVRFAGAVRIYEGRVSLNHLSGTSAKGNKRMFNMKGNYASRLEPDRIAANGLDELRRKDGAKTEVPKETHQKTRTMSGVQ